MLSTFFKIAFRNLYKHKFFSLINIAGLAIGLASCFLIWIYIADERSYDRFNKNASDVYRVNRIFRDSRGALSLSLGTVAAPFGPLLKNDFPDIKAVTRVLGAGFNATFKVGPKLFLEDHAFFAEPTFFSIFSVKTSLSNPAGALVQPNMILLSETMARKYFGTANPVGMRLRINNAIEVLVQGTFANLPENAHMHPQFLISFSTLNNPALFGIDQLTKNFGDNSFSTYVLLRPGASPQVIERAFPAFIDRHMSGQYGSGVAASSQTSLTLLPLNDIHLHAHTDLELEENGDASRLTIFSVIAIAILLIACMNYMNLSTARSLQRAREIAVKKVVGARRRQLIMHFIGESLLLSLIAMVLALVLALCGIPLLNYLSAKHLSADSLHTGLTPLVMLGISILVGLLSGIYPAVYSTSMIPVRVLKGNASRSENFSARRVLVTFQFVLSIVLMICAGMVVVQLNYIRDKNLGFSKDQVVILPAGGMLPAFSSFRTALLSHEGFRDASFSSRIPTGRLLDESGAKIQAGTSMNPVSTSIKLVMCDAHFFNTYQIPLKAGRFVNDALKDDSTSFLLNEAAVKAIGWKSADQAIGKAMVYSGVPGTIRGVVRDFHFENMHEPIKALVFLRPLKGVGTGSVSVKMSGKNLQGRLAILKAVWDRYQPESPFTYSFLDQKVAALYLSEERQATLFGIFSALAIFIACLGLFGLALLATELRKREIGVRKVLGATMVQLVGILSADFMRLVVFANLIAWPLAWYLSQRWLESFAYQAPIAWWLFLSSGVAAALIAFATVSYQAARAASVNPIKSLRTE